MDCTHSKQRWTRAASGGSPERDLYDVQCVSCGVAWQSNRPPPVLVASVTSATRFAMPEGVQPEKPAGGAAE